MEEDGFKLVRNRRRRSKFSKKSKSKNSSTINEYMNDLGTLGVNNENDILEKIEKCLNEISPFVKRFDNAMVEILHSSRIDQIVCFGLGNFTRSRSSMYQLALLRHVMKNGDFVHHDARFIIYDPIFTEFERIILNKMFGFQILAENDDCRYRIQSSQSQSSSMTLFFMPHMDYNHYYNLLNCNDENINHMIIFGNSFNICLNETYFNEYTNDLLIIFSMKFSTVNLCIDFHPNSNNVITMKCPNSGIDFSHATIFYILPAI
ncbi:hypothetical protein BLA29_007760 [Euroglyphus maynei]|uniref:SRR1-like domain-containing protein n=1 Tax=Euroglyphus maynei TaxID=6958 RepID=A0A1Y3AVU7_EURMA|nr:hypothetical protein BLA29_007760 [Euroglyphus maynei]